VHAIHGGTRSWQCVYTLACLGGPGEACTEVLQRLRRHRADGDTLTSAEAGLLIDVLANCCILSMVGGRD
jgi:hypothetical protein